jgi:hypothetical protein
VSVADPTSPHSVGVLDTWAALDVAVAVTDSFAYVADEASGLRVIQITDPTNPQEVGYYNTAGEAYGVAARRNLVFVADDSYFGIYDVSEATSPVTERRPDLATNPAILRAYPNPFNSAAILQLNLPHTVQGRLAVYDVTGRTVSVLMDGSFSGGRHDLRFDASGLASGTYFVRWEARELSLTQKIQLIR